MRVVVDGRVIDDHFPGIGRYVYNLVDALGALESEEDFELILLHRPGRRDARYRLEDLLRHPRVRLHALDAPVFGLASQWKIPAALRALDASVFHATYWMGAWRSGRPSVLSLYDLIGTSLPGSVPGLKTRILSLALRMSIRGADAIITISEAARRDIVASGLTRGQVTVTPLAADAGFRPAEALALRKLREKLALPETMVLYLGINKPHKNLETLVRAWGMLRAERPELVGGVATAPARPSADGAELVIAGRWDPRYDDLKALAAALPQPASIRFLGPVDEEDLPALYSAASIFAFPSRYEGFGLPPLEAMACGTAVIAADATSLPEVVGEAGILVDPDDPSAWAQALARLLEDPDLSEEMGRQGIERAKGFRWEETARRTLEVYRSLS
jgi:alpha-1,3-rhamnosyl/mannosyltransferase